MNFHNFIKNILNDKIDKPQQVIIKNEDEKSTKSMLKVKN